VNRALVDRIELRGIAAFEAAKGAIALLGALGLFELRHATFDPSHLVGRELVRIVAATSRIPFWLVVVSAIAYTAVRWTEAWGIWYAKRWAFWLGGACGGIYLPIEVYEFTRHATWTRAGLVLGNICVVILMLTWLRHAPATEPG
jgi:uncharacterized membrane protein (DUF2068 family)